jgi:putative ABC transport system permease protein
MRLARPRMRGASRTVWVEPTGLAVRDLAHEALASILVRPGRAGLTVLGTLLGVAAFVAVLGLTTTASSQISQRFSVLRATEVVVEDTATDQELAGPAFPPDADQRVEALNGVAHAGVIWSPPLRNPTTSALPFANGRGRDERAEQLPVLAASPGALHAMHARLASGMLYNRFHQGRAERVAVLGVAAARRLGIGRLDAQPAIFVAGVPLTVVGIIDHVDRHADSLLAVLVPSQTADRLWGPPERGEPARMLIETLLGSASQVGSQASLALRPDTPERFKTTVPPDPRTLREDVAGDLNLLFLLLAGISLVIGTVGIANTTLVAVLERVPEIGLRRAVGARRHHIAAQFLAESGTLGTLGGLVGTSLGVLTVVTVAVTRHWTPVVQPWTVLPAPLVGGLTGVLAGIYPAYRATRIEPLDALQR